MLTVQYLLESAFCLSCLYALYWLLLRRETFFQWNRAYLLLAPVLACLAPALHIRIAASMSPAAAAPAAGDLMPAPLADLPQWVDRLQTAPRLVGQALEQPLWSLTLGEALRWVYGVVAAFFMLHLLAQVWRLLAFLRRCKRTEQAGVVLATGPAGAPLASFSDLCSGTPAMRTTASNGSCSSTRWCTCASGTASTCC